MYCGIGVELHASIGGGGRDDWVITYYDVSVPCCHSFETCDFFFIKYKILQ